MMRCSVGITAIGFLFTYVAPLVFVLSLTMMKEGYDDWCRYCRDKEANSQVHFSLFSSSFCSFASYISMLYHLDV
jgi:phospholipid-translocating ATPase